MSDWFRIDKRGSLWKSRPRRRRGRQRENHRHGRAGFATLLFSASIFLSRGLSLTASLSHVEEPARREPGVDEVVGQVGAPLIETGPVEHVIAGRLGGVEQVSVGVVLVLLAPGIAPVVEDLAAEQMP